MCITQCTLVHHRAKGEIQFSANQVAKIDKPDMLFDFLHIGFSRLNKCKSCGLTVCRHFLSGKTWPCKIDTWEASWPGVWQIRRCNLDDWRDSKPGTTRRKGQWLNTRTLEIYVQEVAAAVFLSDIEPRIRDMLFWWQGLCLRYLNARDRFLVRVWKKRRGLLHFAKLEEFKATIRAGWVVKAKSLESKCRVRSLDMGENEMDELLLQVAMVPELFIQVTPPLHAPPAGQNYFVFIR